MQIEGKEILIACTVALTVGGILWRLGKFLFVSLTSLVKDYFESIKNDIKDALIMARENNSKITYVEKDIDNLAENIRKDIINVESDLLKLCEELEKCRDKHDK